MAGKLDEISSSIGALREAVAGLRRERAGDRATSDDRHDEYRRSLASIGARVGKVEQAMAPLANTVAVMEPIVAGYAISQWKKAGAIGLAIAMLGVLGLVIERALGVAFDWLLTRLLH